VWHVPLSLAGIQAVAVEQCGGGAHRRHGCRFGQADSAASTTARLHRRRGISWV